jgi:myosin heavy chain 9/10/11/14
LVSSYLFVVEHSSSTQQLVQQRTAQGELETQRGQVRELAQAKKQLQSEVTELREQLEISKNEASSLY